MKILVAEDDQTMRFLMAAILSRHEIDCTVVGDGRKAVEEWERERYDCILMDLQMPDLDGLAATREIREIERSTGGHTIIIAVTAFADESDRERCLEAGMDDYLSKPVDMDLLLSLVVKHARIRPPSPT